MADSPLRTKQGDSLCSARYADDLDRFVRLVDAYVEGELTDDEFATEQFKHVALNAIRDGHVLSPEHAALLAAAQSQGLHRRTDGRLEPKP